MVKKLYQCEICHTPHYEEALATKCEARGIYGPIIEPGFVFVRAKDKNQINNYSIREYLTRDCSIFVVFNQFNQRHLRTYSLARIPDNFREEGITLQIFDSLTSNDIIRGINEERALAIADDSLLKDLSCLLHRRDPESPYFKENEERLLNLPFHNSWDYSAIPFTDCEEEKKEANRRP